MIGDKFDNQLNKHHYEFKKQPKTSRESTFGFYR